MIEFIDIHKSFGPKHVLRGVTVTVETGSVFYIVGTSGAGKSVLVKQLVGLLRPDRGRIVLDGRDIGTVVCPEANVKIYLDASLEARAARRVKELRLRGSESIESRVLQEMKDRDARDSGRAVAPLKAAEDALRIDTTDLMPDEVFDRSLTYIAARLE